MPVVMRFAVFLVVLIGVAGAGPARAAELPLAHDFDGADGAPWPAPWFAGGAHVTTWDLQGNRGRLNGDLQRVARMILPGYLESDVEAAVTVEFEAVHSQGFGFYVRQNGGTLQEYTPHGQGYAMFLKGAWGWPQDLGLWREIDGVETQFAQGYDPVPAGLENATRYRLRFRVTQSDPATTLLQARVWPESEPEPAAWTIEATDTEPLLQNTAGSFAIDIYNQFGSSPIYVDDLLLRRYPYPTSAEDAVHAPLLALSAPFPHPVRSLARIDLDLPAAANARLRVYDAAGRCVAQPFEGPLTAGRSTVVWNLADRGGTRPRAGVYFLRLDAGGREASRRVVVIE